MDLGDGRWLVVDLMICSVSFIIFFYHFNVKCDLCASF